MINIYKTNNNILAEIQEPSMGSWISAINPTPAEIDELVGLGLPRDYLTYPLDMDERARTERENRELLIVLRVPYYLGPEADFPYGTMPLGIILSHDCTVTVSKEPNDIINAFTSGRIRSFSTSKTNRFILHILLRTADRYLSFLREINKDVDVLEDKLQLSTRNQELMELLKYQKSLTIFTTSLKSNELMMERLQRSRLFNMYPEDEDLLEDVLTENRQAIEMTNIAGSILSQMMDAFASIISNNLNSVMKILASITIVASLPTMVASFYGMNVDLPMASSPVAFMLILGLSLLFSVTAVVFFIKRGWF